LDKNKLSEVLLEAIGIVGSKNDDEEYHPTIGGMLLFGTNPSLFLPHVYVKTAYNEYINYFYGNIPT